MKAFRTTALNYRELVRSLGKEGFRIQDEAKYGWGGALDRPILRPYQEAALTAWRDAKGRGVVVLPTGAGKTHVAIAAIARVGKPAICLVPTRILLEQWRDQLQTQFGMSIGILGDGRQELAPILVSTFESAYRYMNWIGNRFQLLVVDEVHHFGIGIRDEALEMCVAPFRLGLTATPVTNSASRKRLNELIGPEVYEISVSDLTGKFLAPFEHVTVPIDLYPDERESYEREISLFRNEFDQFSEAHRGGRWVEFVAWATRRPEGKRALLAHRRARHLLSFSWGKEEALCELFERHKYSKTLVFTADTDAAYRLSRRFLVAAITSDIKKGEREDVLEKFKRGLLRRLVSCRVLNEGIDVPDAEIAIILGGNHGEREHVQRIGRCLRPSPGKVAKVYELVAKNTMEVRHWQKRIESLAPRISA